LLPRRQAEGLEPTVLFRQQGNKLIMNNREAQLETITIEDEKEIARKNQECNS